MSNLTVNDHHDLLKLQNDLNTTVLTISNHVRDIWKSPSGTLIRIEFLVSLAAVFYLFLITFGSHRRRHRNWFIQKGILGAYTLSFSLVSYTLGSMQSSAVKSSMYPIWAISLHILHGCSANSITAYSLDDTIGRSIFNYKGSLYTAYVLLLILSVGSSNADYLSLVFCFVYAIAHSKYGHRVAAYALASRSWNLNKVIADYMYDEHKKGSFVPATMEGCHYLVDWPPGKSNLDGLSYVTTQLIDDAGDEVIDIEKIWLYNNKSLSPELKDVCLSFSLSQLLRRRYFGFDCGESKERAHDFVFKGLLLENDDGATDYNRVFKLIEVELAFMYDFFFTKYAVIYYAPRAATIWSLLSLTSCISLAAYVIAKHTGKNLHFQDNSLVMSATTADVVIVLLILACAGFLELLQLLLYWTSIWGRVSFVCQYLREQPSYIMRLKEFLAKIGVYYESNKQYWLHKLGQYSLFESVSYNASTSEKGLRLSIKFMLRALLLFDVRHTHPTNSYASKVRGKHGIPIKLPVQVKEAVVHSLKRTDGKLTNGESSLGYNRACHLLWTFSRGMHPGTSWSQRKENQTHLILTWHIATCYCEMARTKHPCSNEGTELKVHLEVATILSRYCAYLVVSAPRLLPGHHYDTRRVFDAVAKEAYKFFTSSKDKYEEMRNLTESEESVFRRGAKLGKQLEKMPEGTRWKVMADFWAEMMLYVAPSDNVKEHIEQLAQGGEFITHLWALLSHAGILERDHQNPNNPRAENTQSSVGHQAARHATFVPASPLGGSVLQAPPSPGANERRIDVAEV